jgi:membrane protein implicated in regulation of membrane protease activity
VVVVEWILDITAYLWLVWLVIVLTAVVVELLTLEFTFLMIAAGALVGGLGANLLGFPWWAQVAAAAIVTALLLLLIRPVLLRTVGKNDPLIPTNVDALANMEATAVVDFEGGAGMVKLRNGETWTARLVAPDLEVSNGQALRVVSIDGATVVVDPVLVSEEGV